MNVETIKRNFDRGLWTVAMVGKAARKGVITPEQYSAITSAPDSDLYDTPESIVALFTQKIQDRLDSFARSDGRRYDNILSLCSYATSTNPVFAAEGQYGVEIRDSTWAAANAVMNAVTSGQRSIPTWEELEAELPVLQWPEVVSE